MNTEQASRVNGKLVNIVFTLFIPIDSVTAYLTERVVMTIE